MRMPILSRYILVKQVKPFFLSLFLFLVILLLNRIFELVHLIVGRGVPIAIVGKILLYSLPFIVSLVIPMAVMISIIVSFGDMSEKYEIIGIYSCGIDLKPLIIPLFIVIAVMFVLLSVFNAYIVPSSNRLLKNTLYDVTHIKPSSTVEEGIFFNSFDNRYLIFIDKISKNDSIKNVYIKEKIDRKRWRIISAPYGIIASFGKDAVLSLKDGVFVDVTAGRENSYLRGKFERYTVSIPLEDSLEERERHYVSDREMTLTQLLSKVDSLKSNSAASRKGLKRRINRYMVEVHKKFSIPFAMVVFLFMGVPVGIMMRKGNIGVAVGSGLIIFIIYYVFLIGGEQLADRGVLPAFWGMWFPNIFFLIISLLLYIKTGGIIFRREK